MPRPLARPRSRWIAAVALAVIVAACMDRTPPTAARDADRAPSFAAAEAAGDRGAAPTSAIMEFGRPELGSTYAPPEGHDASTHAKDKMNPRTVVIAVGGTVTFRVAPFHNPAIYDAGTEPEDIEVSPRTLRPLSPGPVFIPNFVIDDPTNRLWQGSYALVPQERTSPPFTAPGRYLVICTTVPHFVDNNMYGWVIVQ